jgi:regulator of sigma E protease
LHLNVTDADGHGRHTLVLDTDRLDSGELDAQSLRKIGMGGPFSAPLLGKVSPGGAGDQAGLQSGDLVQAVDGALLTDAATLRRLIRSAVLDGQARTMLWRIERAGKLLELPVTPKVLVDAGKPIGRIEVMVGAAPALVTVRYGFFDGLLRGFERTKDMSWMTLKMFGRMLVGEASLQNLSGPLTIADYAGQSVRMGLGHYLGFLGLLSVSLGILNLLPLPMLDGGHLMYYCFEGITGRAISEWWQTQLQRAGALILILMMALALSNDVVRLTGLH